MSIKIYRIIGLERVIGFDSGQVFTGDRHPWGNLEDTYVMPSEPRVPLVINGKDYECFYPVEIPGVALLIPLSDVSPVAVLACEQCSAVYDLKTKEQICIEW